MYPRGLVKYTTLNSGESMLASEVHRHMQVSAVS